MRLFILSSGGLSGRGSLVRAEPLFFEIQKVNEGTVLCLILINQRTVPLDLQDIHVKRPNPPKRCQEGRATRIIRQRQDTTLMKAEKGNGG